MGFRSAKQATQYYYEKDPLYPSGDGLKWVGGAAADIGLTGQVQREEFVNVMSGLSPDGTKIMRKLTIDEKGDAIRACFDLQLNVPKSWSTIVILDKEVRADVEKLLEKTAAYVADNQCYTRIRNPITGEQELVQGRGMTALALHTTARTVAGDKHGIPDQHFHGHVTITGVERPDGTLGQIETDSKNENSFLHADNHKMRQQMINNGLFEIAEKHGLNIETHVNKGGLVIPEIKGLVDLNEQFSSRHKAIQESENLREALAIAYPNKSEKELDLLIELRTKSDKNYNVTEQDLTDRIKSMSPNLDELLKEARSPNQTLNAEQIPMKQHINDAMQGLQEQESVVSRAKLITEALKLSAGHGGTFDSVNATLSGMVKDKELVQSGNKYTTVERLETELNFREELVSRKQEFNAFCTVDEATKLLKEQEIVQGFEFSKGQFEASKHVLTSKDGVTAIKGFAGTGKSTMYQAINNILTEKSVQVIGIAPTGAASVELNNAGLANYMTIDSFLLRQEGKNAFDLSKPTLIVCDESGMVGIENMSKMLEVTKGTQATINLLGDYQQLIPIAAGESFKDATKLLETVSMREVKRQDNAQYRDAVGLLTQHYQAIANDKTGDYKGEFAAKYLDAISNADNCTVTRIEHQESATSEAKLQTTAQAIANGHMQQIRDAKAGNIKYDSAKTGARETYKWDDLKSTHGILTATHREKEATLNAVRPQLKAENLIGEQAFNKYSEILRKAGYTETQMQSIEKGDHIYTTKQLVRMSKTDTKFATNYGIGNTLALTKETEIDGKKLEGGAELTIQNINLEKNSLTLIDANGAQIETGNLRKLGLDAKQWQPHQMTLASGERALITENDNTVEGRRLGRVNGATPHYIGYNNETQKAILAAEKNGKYIAYEIDPTNKAMTNGTVITTNQGQGKGYDFTTSSLSSQSEQMHNFQRTYVDNTRGKIGHLVVTDIHDKSILNALNHVEIKTNSLDIIGGKDTDNETLRRNLNELKTAPTSDELKQSLTNFIDAQKAKIATPEATKQEQQQDIKIQHQEQQIKPEIQQERTYELSM